MKILIDGQTLHSPEKYRGIGRYLINILTSLIHVFPSNSYTISLTEDVDSWDLPDNFKKAEFSRIHLDPQIRESNFREMQYRQALEEIILQNNVDIYWNPNPLMTNVLFAGKLKGCKNIATVHDVIPLKFPNDYLHHLAMGIFEDYMSRLIRLSSFDCIFADSKTTAKDLKIFTEISKEKIFVLYYGLDKAFFDEVPRNEIQEIKLRYGLPENYIFAMGGPNARKNCTALIEAFSILINKYKEQIHLVLGSSYDSLTKSKINNLWFLL